MTTEDRKALDERSSSQVPPDRMSVFAEVVLPPESGPLRESLAAFPDVVIRIERSVPTGGHLQYAWIAGPGHQEFVDRVRATAPGVDMALVDELPERVMVRVKPAELDTQILDQLQETDSTVSGARGSREGWVISIRCPDEAALQRTVRTLQGRAPSVTVQRLAWGHTARPYGLTDVQRQTIQLAFDADYFNVPRGATLEDLGTTLGISEQAVSERLRRGLAGLLEAALSDDPHPLDRTG